MHLSNMLINLWCIHVFTDGSALLHHVLVTAGGPLLLSTGNWLHHNCLCGVSGFPNSDQILMGPPCVVYVNVCNSSSLCSVFLKHESSDLIIILFKSSTTRFPRFVNYILSHLCQMKCIYDEHHRLHPFKWDILQNWWLTNLFCITVWAYSENVTGSAKTVEKTLINLSKNSNTHFLFPC